mgnify:CR=1 FL=1
MPDGARDENGALLHDDLLMADALAAKLDELRWTAGLEPFAIAAPDPLEELSRTQ